MTVMDDNIDYLGSWWSPVSGSACTKAPTQLPPHWHQLIN